MKTIYENEYSPALGILIDVKDPLSYKEKHNPYSINIYYDKLLMNHKTLLSKNKKYYIICDKGHKSKQAVRILSFYGYDVTYVINS
ncbi:MAG: rhodanese-like domain-containing protein [Bacilli bacterium]|nr:rhodanese-like domain-containing protein [Bacilli bacterium]